MEKLEPIWTKIRNKPKLAAAAGGALVVLCLASSYKKKVNGKTPPAIVDATMELDKAEEQGLERKIEHPINPNDNKKRKLNSEFIRQLAQLLRIVLPGIWTKEAAILTIHTLFLVSRTYISIVVARMDGIIIRTIVERKPRDFAINLGKWLLLAVPATYVNSMIRYLESKLAIAFRNRLSDHCYSMYMSNDVYYSVGNLDSRLSNPDQCLTEDINKFSSNLAHLHGQISKPALDVVLMTWQLLLLANTAGAGVGGMVSPTAVAVLAVVVTIRVLKYFTPPFGKLISRQAELEGELRFAHSRLISNAEEIAFYGGHEVEKGVLSRAYKRLEKHMNYIYRLRIFYNMLEGYLMKYLWSAAGMCCIGLPAFYAKLVGINDDDVMVGVTERTQYAVTARGLLINGADAMERIMTSYKEVTELAGYASRVHELISVFEDVSEGKYQKKSVGGGTVIKSKGKSSDGDESIDIQKEIEGGSVLLGRGHVTEADFIKFDNVPIITPNGDVLINALSMKIGSGMHLLITGPNGCGKSSLFRILGGLWPVYGGVLSKPNRKDLFYIPQRPYLSVGTLRDQIIYPHTKEEMERDGKSDKDLELIMEWVHLSYIIEREGGWNAHKSDWEDVLSGGEKQRVGMARVLYHRPKFAILDECTSAVSIDVEGKMYIKAIELGITLLTVTHRPSLWKYHNHLLQFDGEGGYQFMPLNAESRMSLKEEKIQLESQLSGIPRVYNRLKELCNLLGEDSLTLKQASMNNLTAFVQSVNTEDH